MVKYADINKAIVSKLKNKFKNIEIVSTDMNEGIIRPSFFIDFDDMKSNDFMGEMIDREITVRIYYFSSDRYKNKIELLNMQDELNDLFMQNNIIEIDEFTKVEIEELEFNIVDKVLHCYFNIMLSEDYDRYDNDVEIMEDLQFKNL
ncbi:phage tail terminator family protein [Caminicella sporogenes]|uniref:phage tail terminator family protein n=1 Tax=Caminicella sporogenes TaxID=166485 RepID=UPI002541C5AD|nr:hypothetical protein [Caminicella sporogenes]WIF95124.1 hypothetical protein QNI18_00350 [Caminicella sporogenes]